MRYAQSDGGLGGLLRTWRIIHCSFLFYSNFSILRTVVSSVDFFVNMKYFNIICPECRENGGRFESHVRGGLLRENSAVLSSRRRRGDRDSLFLLFGNDAILVGNRWHASERPRKKGNGWHEGRPCVFAGDREIGRKE